MRDPVDFFCAVFYLFIVILLPATALRTYITASVELTRVARENSREPLRGSIPFFPLLFRWFPRTAARFPWGAFFVVTGISASSPLFLSRPLRLVAALSCRCLHLSHPSLLLSRPLPISPVALTPPRAHSLRP